jgi:general stress protein YciG
MNDKHTKQTAGQLGGRATFARYGRNHMQDIGAKGALTTWTRYQLMPYSQTEYALVQRATGKIIRIVGR